jgi:PAS domain S-box-containing protein
MHSVIEGQIMSDTSEEIIVLHVDDDSAIRSLTAAFLERIDNSFEVLTAASAAEGRQYLQDYDVDAVVSDYDMPREDGLDFLEDVREDYDEMPFILFTGKGSEEIASEAISRGVTDYLQKEPGNDQYTILANRLRNSVEKVRAKQEQQRQLNAIETAQEGIAFLDEDGYFTYVNQAYAELYEYDPDEMIGDQWGMLYPKGKESRVQDEILPIVETTGYWHGQTVGLRQSGETFIEDHALAKTDQGGLICTVRDVTDEQERIKELELKTRAMDAAPIGILITNYLAEDNPIIYANEGFQELTGYSEEEILGRNCRFLQGEQTSQEPVDKLRAAVNNHDPVTVELRNYKKDGTEFWNRVSIAPVSDDDGNVTHFIGFQQDITKWIENRPE